MKITKVVLISLVVLLVIWLALWIKGQLEIDRCLDSGGRWDYEKSMCFYAPDDSTPK